EVRRPHRQHQKIGIGGLGLLLDEGAGVSGLGDGIIAGPVFRRRVIALVVERVIVIVTALAGLPVIESEALVRRDVGETAAVLSVRTAVEVPLPDETGAI